MLNGLLNVFAGGLFKKWPSVSRERLHHQGVNVEVVDFGKVRRCDGFANETESGEGGRGIGHGAILSAARWLW